MPTISGNCSVSFRGKRPKRNGKNDITNPPEKQAPKLLDQVRDRIRVKHYSLRTEDAYVGWIKRFILFHNKRHPREMGARAIEAFLSYHLATERDVSASTQNQALSAVLFLYKEVLEIQLPWLDDVTRARTPKRLPVVLTEDETKRVLVTDRAFTLRHRNALDGVSALTGQRCGILSS